MRQILLGYPISKFGKKRKRLIAIKVHNFFIHRSDPIITTSLGSLLVFLTAMSLIVIHVSYPQRVYESSSRSTSDTFCGTHTAKEISWHGPTDVSTANSLTVVLI